MQKLIFIDCYGGQPIKDIGIINLKNGTVFSIEISERRLGTASTDAIYQMELKVSSDFPYLDKLAGDFSAGIYGVRYQTENQNLAFIIRDKIKESDGSWTLKLRSSLDMLTEKYSYLGEIKEKTINGILNKLDSRFEYILISPDRNINLTFEPKNDYEILKAIVNQAENWGFRENKLIKVGTEKRDDFWKTQILIGDFARDIENYYKASPETRSECKPLEISSFRKISNLLDLDQTFPNLSKQHFSSLFPNRLIVIGKSNIGTSANSNIYLEPDLIKQKPDFPLTAIEINGKQIWAIQNIYDQNPLPERVKVVTYQNSSNDLDAFGNAVSDNTVSNQQLYQFGCTHLQSFNYKSYFSTSSTDSKQLLLPGNIANTKIKTISYTKDSGTEIIFDIDEKKLINSIGTINLTLVKN